MESLLAHKSMFQFWVCCQTLSSQFVDTSTTIFHQSQVLQDTALSYGLLLRYLLLLLPLLPLDELVLLPPLHEFD